MDYVRFIIKIPVFTTLLGRGESTSLQRRIRDATGRVEKRRKGALRFSGYPLQHSHDAGEHLHNRSLTPSSCQASYNCVADLLAGVESQVHFGGLEELLLHSRGVFAMLSVNNVITELVDAGPGTDFKVDNNQSHG